MINMAGKVENATHQDDTNFEGPVDTGNPKAKRPADKDAGDKGADTSAAKDKGKVFDSGKVAEEISQLFAGFELSEDFAPKAAVILEGALSAKIEDLREQFEQEYETRLQEAVEQSNALLEDRLDGYLTYVAEQYMAENKLAIDQGIKNDIAEQVMTSVVSIIESNGVTIPDDKVDISEALVEEVRDIESKLNESVNTIVSLNERIKGFEIKEAFDELSGGLSTASREKLAKLSENISYKDVEDYKARVTILKESVTAPATPSTQDLNEQTQPVKNVPVAEDKQMSERMKAYLTAVRF